MNKIKNYTTVILFCLLIFGFCAAFIFLPKSDMSKSERRKLARFPETTTESVLSGDFFEKLESYLLDHFPLREEFRSINAAVRTKALLQSDVNGLWISDGSIFKYESDLKEAQVEYGAEIINKVCDEYLDGMNIYYSVIPDKNYYAADDGLHPKFDYNGMLDILGENVKKAKYIDIFDTLELDVYYKTDTHWSQDKIFPTVYRLAEAMGISEYLTPEEAYETKELGPFYGVYYGQAALSTAPDKLYYMTSNNTENAVVLGLDETAETTVYALDKFDGMDGYDIFLSGAQSVLTIECPGARTDRELIIFRDSYGSSIAPLFTGAYSKITLIDLRYYPVFMLKNAVEFKEGQDVLFLYSTLLLNSSMLMK